MECYWSPVSHSLNLQWTFILLIACKCYNNECNNCNNEFPLGNDFPSYYLKQKQNLSLLSILIIPIWHEIRQNGVTMSAHFSIIQKKQCSFTIFIESVNFSASVQLWYNNSWVYGRRTATPFGNKITGRVFYWRDNSKRHCHLSNAETILTQYCLTIL